MRPPERPIVPAPSVEWRIALRPFACATLLVFVAGLALTVLTLAAVIAAPAMLVQVLLFSATAVSGPLALWLGRTEKRRELVLAILPRGSHAPGDRVVDPPDSGPRPDPAPRERLLLVHRGRSRRG